MQAKKGNVSIVSKEILLFARNWQQSKYLQIAVHEFVDLHDGSLVTAAVAVVGRTKHRYYVALV